MAANETVRLAVLFNNSLIYGMGKLDQSDVDVNTVERCSM